MSRISLRTPMASANRIPCGREMLKNARNIEPWPCAKQNMPA